MRPARRLPFRPLALLALLGAVGPATAKSSGPLRLEVDLREADRLIVHARLTIPASPGPLSLFFPKWIPGEHGPTGPIADLAGLEFRAAGRRLDWERDPLDMYALRLFVPSGATALEATLDYLVPGAGGRFSEGPSASAKSAVLSWNTVVLYPAGTPATEILVEPSLILPDGWRFGTALSVAARDGERVRFATVPLATLIDSPVSAGAHYRRLELGTVFDAPHELHLVADSEGALALGDSTRAAYERLVPEALTLFGARHYRAYHFLLTLSDHLAHFGLEHHESSDNRLPERALLDPDQLLSNASLLPHEFVHSWNAKYRRPVGLATTDYQQPMIDDLLWVYEGLTSYLGAVLTARSGLWTPEQAREALALIAAGMDLRPGRTWRPLSDTARAAQILYGARRAGSSWRRGVDFYNEGVLIWLDVDTTLRELTGDRRSLDDFCSAFYGGLNGPALVRPYALDDLLAALGRVAAHDWGGFFDTRLGSIERHAPLGGIVRSGWRLVFSEGVNALQQAHERSDHELDLRFSLGFVLRDKDRDSEHGSVLETIPGTPAAAAGLAPGMRLVAVNGRRWSANVLRDALRAAREHGGPIELLVEGSEFYKTLSIDYRLGERYPHLAPETDRPDRLSDILRRHAPTAPPAPPG